VGPIGCRRSSELARRCAKLHRDHKGILVGNGYRLTAPDAAERQKQFSEHAIRGAMKNDFCLVPTTELFKAVCAALESPEDEGLKIEIRESILSAVGIWTFAREITTSAESRPASALAANKRWKSVRWWG
jgi:hypothetical protein